MAFNVNSPITVTALGLYNYSGTGLISTTDQVVIFNTTTNAEVTPVVTFHGQYTTAGFGYNVFQSINPVALGAGSYEVDEVGLEEDGDLMGNQAHGANGAIGPTLNSGGGVLTFNGALYNFDTSGLDEPTPRNSGCPGCNPLPAQSSQFDVGTFEFDDAVPEPSTWMMMLFGFVGLGFAGYRRRSRKSAASLAVA